MRIYEKPCMKVTYYNAMDNTNNLNLIVSAPIAAYTDKSKMSNQSFTLHH